MAQNVGYNLTIHADSGNFKQIENEVTSGIAKNKAELQSLDDLIKNGEATLETYINKEKVLSEQSINLNNKKAIIQKKINDLINDSSGKDNTAQINKYQAQIAKVNTELQKNERYSKAAKKGQEELSGEVSKTAQNTNKLTGFLGKLNTAFQNVKNINLKNTSESVDGLKNKLSSIKTIAFGTFIANEARSALNGVKNLTGEMASSSDAVTSMKIALKSTGEYSSAQIDSMVKQSQDFANKSVYNLKEVTQTTRTLAALHVKNAEGITEALGDINSATGGTSEQFSQLTDIIRQTASTGKLQWEDLKRGLEQSPESFSLMAKASGESMNQFVNNVKNGKVSWTDLQKAIENADKDKSVKGVAEQTNTIGQAMEGLDASIVQVGTDLLQSFSPKIIKIINNISDSIQKTWDIIQSLNSNNNVKLASLLGISSNSAGTLLQTFNNIKQQISTQIQQIKQSLDNSGISISKALGIDGDKGTTLSNTIAFLGTIIVTFLSTVNQAIIILTPSMKFMAEIMKKIIDFATQYPEAFTKIAIIITTLTTILPPLISIISTIITVVKGLNVALDFLALNPVVAIIAAVIAVIAVITLFLTKTKEGQAIVKTVVDFITNYFKNGVAAWKKVFETLNNVLSTLFNGTMYVIKGVFDILTSIVIKWVESVNNKINTLKNIGSDIGNFFYNGIYKPFKDAKDYIFKTIDDINKKTNGIAGKLVSNIFSGLSLNVGGSFGTVSSAIGSMLSNKDFMGYNSSLSNIDYNSINSSNLVNKAYSNSVSSTSTTTTISPSISVYAEKGMDLKQIAQAVESEIFNGYGG